jgi:hypothetical protein
MGDALSAPGPLQPKMSCARLFDRDQISFDWQHYIPFIERKLCALRTHNKRVRF